MSDIIGRTEDFFSSAGAGVRVGTGVFGTVEIVRILEIVGAVVEAIEIKAVKGVGLEASSFCAEYSKAVS